MHNAMIKKNLEKDYFLIEKLLCYFLVPLKINMSYIFVGTQTMNEQPQLRWYYPG